LWNDIFLHTEEYFHITHGTIKATVLIETLPAAFQMNEILYELKDHSAGLNCGRWDYIFSYIKTLRGHSDKILPDREEINMNVHFMKSYSELLIQTCHRRGAHAMGGMAAQIPIRNDKKANDIAIEKVRNDKLTEVKRGHDGTWVAHPGLVSLAMEVFNEYMPMNNQIGYAPKSTNVDQLDLLERPGGPITEAGVRKNIEVGIQYLANWISGNGCVPINNLMEDAATAEISRTQLWQWVTYGVTLDSEKKVTNEFVSSLIDEYVNKVIVNSSNDKLNFSYNRAGVIFKDMTMNDSLENFLTIPAYKELNLGA
jgi:malate synthase